MKKLLIVKDVLPNYSSAQCVYFLEKILINFIVSIFLSSQISIYLSFAGVPMNAVFRVVLLSFSFASFSFFSRNKHAKPTKHRISNIYGLAIFVIVFLWYGATHSDWLRIDRDPGFIALGGKIFQNNPLFGIELSEFTRYPENVTISSPGIYSIRGTNFSPLQGFPGTHEVYAQLAIITNPNTYPLYVGPLLTALVFFLTFKIVRKLTNSLVIPVLMVAIGSSAIPMLYTGRTTFSEPIILLLNLLLIYFHINFKALLRRNTYWICSSLLAFSSTLIRIDALITTVIPWLLYFYIVEIYPRRNSINKIKIFIIQLVAGILILINLNIAQRFSPRYFHVLLVFVQLQVVIFAFANLFLYLLLFLKLNPKNSHRNTLLKSLSVANLTLIVILVLRGLNVFPFNINFDKVYPYTILSLTWYLTPIVLVYIVYLLMKILSLKQVHASNTEISLLAISIIYLVVYGYDLGITIDEPWASRGLIRSIFPLTAILVVTAFCVIMKSLKSKNQIIEFRITNFVFLSIILLGTLIISRSFVLLQADKGQSEFVQKVCLEVEKFSNSSNIVVMDSSLQTWAGPIRESCKLNLVVLREESSFPTESDIEILENQITNVSNADGFVFLSESVSQYGKEINLVYSDYNRPVGRAPNSRVSISQTMYVTYFPHSQ